MQRGSDHHPEILSDNDSRTSSDSSNHDEHATNLSSSQISHTTTGDNIASFANKITGVTVGEFLQEIPQSIVGSEFVVYPGTRETIEALQQKMRSLTFLKRQAIAQSRKRSDLMVHGSSGRGRRAPLHAVGCRHIVSSKFYMPVDPNFEGLVKKPPATTRKWEDIRCVDDAKQYWAEVMALPREALPMYYKLADSKSGESPRK